MTWLTEQISAVGAWVLNQIVYTGRFGHFSWQVIRKFPASLKRFSIVVQQMMFLGNHSLHYRGVGFLHRRGAGAAGL